jgi:hypothetical protein
MLACRNREPFFGRALGYQLSEATCAGGKRWLGTEPPPTAYLASSANEYVIHLVNKFAHTFE